MTSRLSSVASARSIESWRTSAIATFAPASSRFLTIPMPTPLAPPVTKAVRPAKSIMANLSIRDWSGVHGKHRIDRA